MSLAKSNKFFKETFNNSFEHHANKSIFTGFHQLLTVVLHKKIMKIFIKAITVTCSMYVL